MHNLCRRPTGKMVMGEIEYCGGMLKEVKSTDRNQTKVDLVCNRCGVIALTLTEKVKRVA